MSLEGLRAWIGEVERKLGKRTRVFLALAVIAVGLGGAAIYLAIDARESSVSESDVQALQRQLEAQIAASPGGGVSAGGGNEASATQVAQLEAELRALQSEVSQLKGEAGGQKKGASDAGSGAQSGTAPAAGSPGATPPSGAGATAQELLEQAKEESVGNAQDQSTGK